MPDLRNQIIRLAYEKPNLREHLLPIIKESAGEKFIQKAIKDPGALHKHFGIPEDEEIPSSKIDAELAKLKKKSKGDKTLTKAELKLFKQLNLAKTLRSKKVSQG